LPDGTFRPDDPITRAELAAAVVRFMGESLGAPAAFSDIDGHWAQDYINTAAQLGWLIGYEGPGGEFRPDTPVTRAETAALINRMLGRLPESAYDLLPDMLTWSDNADPRAWYYLYIQEATNSHYYVRKADEIHVTWLQLIEPRNWTVLERPTSLPGDIF